MGACEAHGVTNGIAPQAATRGDEHGIVDACLHAFQGDDGGMFASKLTHGDEFVEHIVVDHQQKALVGGVALYAKETFTGVVGLHIVHVGAGDELLVLRAIGCKSDAPVKKHFQIGPHFFQMLLARKFHHAYQNTEHPARNARDIRDIFVQTFVGYAVAFQFEIAQQCRLFLRHPHEIGQGVDILYQDGTEVAHQRTYPIVVGSVAAAEDKAAPIEEFACGMVAQIEGHGVETTSIMNMM